MTKSKTFLYLLLSFISGVFLSLKFAVSPYFWGLFVLSFVFFLRKKTVLIGLILVCLVLGMWRGSSWEEKPSEIGKYNGREVVFTARAVEEPDRREDKVNLTLEVEEAPGRVLVSVGKFSEIRYGDKLRVEGKLRSPPIFKDFDYRDFLEKKGIFSVIYYPEIEILERKTSFYGAVLSFKERLREVLYSNLSPPHSHILGAMVLGDKARMPQELKEKLNRAGVRHLTAVSGMHVIIISGALMSFLLGLGFWRGQAFYVSLAVIFLFVLMIGAHPSAIRAGIMGGFVLLAEKLGRKGAGFQGLILAASLMLFFNPQLLLYDIGFQLSFLAVLGIFYFKSFFDRAFSFMPRFAGLRGVTAMTFSAQIFTLPLIVYQFGTFSLVTPMVNFLILPFIYWIMISGFLFLFLGLFSSSLAFLFSLPSFFLLEYFSKVVDFFSASWAAETVSEVHWVWLLVFYFFLFLLIFVLRQKEKMAFLKY